MNILRHLLKIQQLGIITGIFLVVILLKLLNIIHLSWVCPKRVQFICLNFVLSLGVIVLSMHLRLMKVKAQLEETNP